MRSHIETVQTGIAVAVALAMLTFGCKKDNPAEPPATAGYGSGTVSASSSVGNLSMSGTGVYPPTVPQSVIAVYDTLLNGLLILGYQQVSGSNFNIILVGFAAPGGISSREYAVGDSALFQVWYNINMVDTTGADTTLFNGTSGSIVVTSVSGATVTGTYAGPGSNPAGSHTVDFTGTFTVNYVRGRSPIDLESARSVISRRLFLSDRPS